MSIPRESLSWAELLGSGLLAAARERIPLTAAAAASSLVPTESEGRLAWECPRCRGPLRENPPDLACDRCNEAGPAWYWTTRRIASPAHPCWNDMVDAAALVITLRAVAQRGITDRAADVRRLADLLLGDRRIDPRHAAGIVRGWADGLLPTGTVTAILHEAAAAQLGGERRAG